MDQKEQIKGKIFNIHSLFRNKDIILDEITQQNASKFVQSLKTTMHMFSFFKRNIKKFGAFC